jgi:hypothetical protein
MSNIASFFLAFSFISSIAFTYSYYFPHPSSPYSANLSPPLSLVFSHVFSLLSLPLILCEPLPSTPSLLPNNIKLITSPIILLTHHPHSLLPTHLPPYSPSLSPLFSPLFLPLYISDPLYLLQPFSQLRLLLPTLRPLNLRTSRLRGSFCRLSILLFLLP